MHREPSNAGKSADSSAQSGLNPRDNSRFNLLGEDLLLLSDLMLYTKLSRRKLQNEMAAGALAYVKFGRSARFRPEDVRAYVEARHIRRRR